MLCKIGDLIGAEVTRAQTRSVDGGRADDGGLHMRGRAEDDRVNVAVDVGFRVEGCNFVQRLHVVVAFRGLGGTTIELGLLDVREDACTRCVDEEVGTQGGRYHALGNGGGRGGMVAVSEVKDNIRLCRFGFEHIGGVEVARNSLDVGIDFLQSGGFGLATAECSDLIVRVGVDDEVEGRTADISSCAGADNDC